MASKFYVVWKGRETGIFRDWASCKQQIDHFPGARYKSFKTYEEAQAAYQGKATGSHHTSNAEKKKLYSNKGKASNGGGIGTLDEKDIQKLSLDINIFTDGGCEPNPGKAGSGVAIYQKGVLSELWYGLFDPNGTNNIAELNALSQALQVAESIAKEGSSSIGVFCDSKYSIQCITQWAVNWEKNQWKKSGGEIKNLELIKPLYYLYQSLKDRVNIYHVNGHVGVEGNELADRMSILAIDQKQKAFVRYDGNLDVASLLAMRTG